MKSFIFLYPISEYLDYEIASGAMQHRDRLGVSRFDKQWEHVSSKEEIEALMAEISGFLKTRFKKEYASKLNACINQRYRQQGFQVNYALFDDTDVSDVIILQPSDNIVRVGMDFATHTTQVDGEYPYPDRDYILDQLDKLELLRLGGFHMWDCVEKIARRAYERGITVLVDEDLTEFFTIRIMREDLALDRYPSVDVKDEYEPFSLEEFMTNRKDKPWLWQDY